MRTYANIQAEIVTYLDLDLLIDYCLLVEQIAEMDEMRTMAIATWRALSKRLEKLSTIDPETLSDLLEQLTEAYEQITKIDSRADRKRALLLQLRQSLYLTPRARAAAAPKRKEADAPDTFGDEFD
jgi:phage terminase small subunit